MGANTKNGMPGRYESSPATLENNQGSALLVDALGRLVVVFPTGTSGIGKAEDSAHVSGDIGVMALAKRTDSPASSAGTDGDYATINNDSLGHLWSREGFAPAAEDNTAGVGVFAMARKYVNSATYAASYAQDLGSNATANVKAATGSVVYARITNANAAARYFQIHNKASAASGGDTALRSYIIPAGTAAQPAVLELTQEDFAGPVVCSTGVTWAISTAATTYTAATASEHTINLNYV